MYQGLNLSSPIPLNAAEIIIIPSSPNPLSAAEGRSIFDSRPFRLFRYDRGKKSFSVRREITSAYFVSAIVNVQLKIFDKFRQIPRTMFYLHGLPSLAMATGRLALDSMQ